MGFDLAAYNLYRYLTGQGEHLHLTYSELKQFGAFRESRERNFGHFLRKVKEEAAKLKDGGETTISTYYEATVNPGATSELFYASGGSTIKSTGEIKLKRVGNIVTVAGSIRNYWSDKYDWNPGQAALIPLPGMGVIDDDDAIYLQDFGARDYSMSSSWNTKVSGTITIRSFWFNSNDVKFVNYSKD